MSTKKRVLFMAEAITLAHVVRPAQLASTLSESEYEVHFATDESYRERLCPPNAIFHPIKCMPSKEFQKRLDYGATVFDEKTLDAQILEDIELLQRIRPDVVVGDFRHSLSVSARVCKIPYMGIANSYWSHVDPQLMPVPEIAPFRLLGKGISSLIFDMGRSRILPIVFRKQVKPLNRIRKKYGFAPLETFVDGYLEADIVGFADAFEIVEPNPNFKKPYVCLGPLVGSFRIPLPDWWSQVSADKPMIYLNLGSSGNPKMIPELIKELTKDPIQLVVGFVMDRPQGVEHYPNGAVVFNGQMLPGDLITERANVVINNGGSGGGYQAMFAGKPFIGITKNVDQMVNMHYMTKNSFAREIHNWNCSAQHVREVVRDLLENQIEQKKAREFAHILAKYCPKQYFERALRQIIGESAQLSHL